MGDHVEMVMEGLLCQGCGVFIDSPPAEGFPRSCAQCKPFERKPALPKRKWGKRP